MGVEGAGGLAADGRTSETAQLVEGVDRGCSVGEVGVPLEAVPEVAVVFVMGGGVVVGLVE